MTFVSAFAFGMLFAVGLGLSGMTNPAKVVGFLDVTGAWDPTLAFVMTTAVTVTFVSFRLVLARPAPILAPGFSLPKHQRVTGSLVGGAALFGIGWGLSGYCPGPSLVALVTGWPAVLVFVASMAVGLELGSLVPGTPSPPEREIGAPAAASVATAP
ncbi:MAG TPA: DUF6691 family protein [Candidatus Eisenbacteria bacterium]|nr:DUF6691 family protein [Candidatus Eisenbacteria bacterium]